MTNRTVSTGRRRFLQTGALLCAVGVAGCSGGSGGSSDSGSSDSGSGDSEGGNGSTEPSYSDWLADAPNYDGSAADRTGEETVTVTVGAGNGLLFDPPAVEVSPGTQVVWEWTGQGGQHNVKAESGAFESELASAAGSTFEHTFEDSGAVRYLCVPHQAVGMKGVVDVVEE